MPRRRSRPMCRSTSRPKCWRRKRPNCARDYPRLKVLPVAADFTKPFRCRRQSPACRARIFPRLDHRQFRAARGLRVPAPCRRACSGPAPSSIIGVDLVKDAAVLNAAYNDAAGVTAKFNLNLLARINRELGADFDLDELLPPGVLQQRAPAGGNAPRQPQAPEGAYCGRHDRIPRRRNHPHREQLQIHGRILRRAGARLRLDAGRRMVRPAEAISPCRRSARDEWRSVRRALSMAV